MDAYFLTVGIAWCHVANKKEHDSSFHSCLLLRLKDEKKPHEIKRITSIPANIWKLDAGVPAYSRQHQNLPLLNLSAFGGKVKGVKTFIKPVKQKYVI